MLPQSISSFENLRNLATIVELKKLQRWVTYFCAQPLGIGIIKALPERYLQNENCIHIGFDTVYGLRFQSRQD